jgi:hypothetical protein
VRDHRRAVGKPDIEHEAVAIDAEIERIRTALVTGRAEGVLLNQVVDRDRTLMLNVGTRTADRRLVERHRHQTAGIAVVGTRVRH